MNAAKFDAAGFMRINLADGDLQSAAGDHLSAVPTSILGALTPSGPLLEAATEWGRQHGARFSQDSGSSLATLELGALANYLGGTLAALGYGSLAIQTHGSALVFKLSSAVAAPTAGRDALLQGFLAGFLRALSPNPFEVTPLGTEGREQLFLAGNPAAIQQANTRVAGGTSPIQILTQLSGGKR